jgi:beta-glucosidase
MPSNNNNNSIPMSSPSWPQDTFDQLTFEEKLLLLSGKSMWSSQAIDRVGVPSIWLSDGPQGIRKVVSETAALESHKATCFPTSCALACSWNRDLLERVGRALSKECRQQDVNVLLGPGLNLRRHPCGGRNFEYFSEDPVVSGHIAAAMVKGIQSSNHVGACIKHVCVNNQESWRFRVNVLVDERTLRELYLKGFEYVVKEAKPWTMMCAYNQLNGVYCSENEWLFQELIRKEWGYEGLVMTDWGATNQRAKGIQAGVDLEMPGSYGIHDSLITTALKDGSLSQDKFDEAVMRNLKLIQRSATGMKNGDNTGAHKMPDRGEDLYESHHELAYESALDCVVLLQNNDNMLPLSSKKQSAIKPTKVAIVGDFCRDPRYQGMGSSQVNSTKVDTILEHINMYTDNFVFSKGYCNADADEEEEEGNQLNIFASRHKNNLLKEQKRMDMIEQAVEDAKDAEAVIIMAGVPEIHESEGFDRENLDLPASQNLLIERICEVNPNVIVVLSNGGPVLMPWKNKVKAIVESYLLGQAGARAVLDILFGVASPSGKLTETFPLATTDVPSNNYFPGDPHTVEYREGLNVGYRYYDTAQLPVLFPFGHGLSYASFAYTNCECKVAQGGEGSLVEVKCTITNEGKRAGAEIVQIYVHHDEAGTSVYHPEHQLQDFKKTNVLEPGESEELVFNLTAEAFAFFDNGVSAWILEEGAKYEIRIAQSSRDVRWTGSIDIADIVSSGNCKLNIAKPSEEAHISHPPVTKKQLVAPLVVNDATFESMLDKHPHDLMHLSAKTMLGRSVAEEAPLLSCQVGAGVSDPSLRLLPHDIAVIHRNSFLSEIEQNGCFGKTFVNIIMKVMETELDNPNDVRQRKMIREVARNLPIRCLATYSRGSMSFDLLDTLISLFNGHYFQSLSFFSTSTRKAATGMFVRR